MGHCVRLNQLRRQFQNCAQYVGCKHKQVKVINTYAQIYTEKLMGSLQGKGPQFLTKTSSGVPYPFLCMNVDPSTLGEGAHLDQTSMEKVTVWAGGTSTRHPGTKIRN